jgi:hypothetical protein
MESGGIAPFIVNSALDGCESLPSHPSWFAPRERDPSTHCKKKLGRPQSRSGHHSEDKNPFSLLGCCLYFLHKLT